MPLINWNDGLSVKIKEIDQQHQSLIAMINELNDAMKQGQGDDVIKKIIDGLIDYADTHFKTEEKYFDQFGYPDAECHKKEHADFFQEVINFKKGFEEGRITVSIEVMNFLSEWFNNHLVNSDRKYTYFFKDKGLV